MNGLNKLEEAVLNWVSEHTENSRLINQLSTAQLKEREWTKVGFHIQLEVDKDCESLNEKFPITGPVIESKDIEHNGGLLIWGEDGCVSGLELFAYGSYFKESVSEFKLSKLENYK